MVSTLISDGMAIRIEVRKSWRALIPALPFFFGAFYLFVATALGLKNLITASGHTIGEYLSVFLFLIFGLALNAAGLLIASSRFFVIDKARGEVSRTFQIGPLKWRRRRKLSDFNLVRVDWEPDSDGRGGTYFVCLSGEAGTGALRLSSFESSPPANALARELGGALGLPFRDAPGRVSGANRAI